jgi:hypothetical protein
MDLLYISGLLATAAFAASGVLAALGKRIDLFGAVVVAVVTALGGGTLRDLILNAPICWLRDEAWLLVAVVIGCFARTLRYAHYLGFDGSVCRASMVWVEQHRSAVPRRGDHFCFQGVGHSIRPPHALQVCQSTIRIGRSSTIPRGFGSLQKHHGQYSQNHDQ